MAEYTIPEVSGPVLFDVEYAQGFAVTPFESTGAISATINQSIVAGAFESTGALACSGFSRAVSAGAFESTGAIGGAFMLSTGIPSVTRYQCLLTGTPDLVLPISSFQARIRNGEPTYLEVVVPNAADYADDITDRTSGEIVVGKAAAIWTDGTTYYAEIARADFDSLQTDQGATAYTARLSGHQTKTYSAPRTRALADVMTIAMQADGKRRVRCAVDFIARPGDTVTWNSGADSMTAGVITLTVAVLQQIMDITEA